jgi:glycosyltransferase involved in cell wall biosynthesis
VHHALGAAGVPVVQTLHNYRLLCPQGMLLRSGRPCVDCVGRAPLPGVLHACYRESRAASAAVAVMLTVHRGIGTWTRRVDAFIALSRFARDRFVEGGLPADRLHVKPNFLDPDPGVGSGRGGFLLYVGRLSPEKGIPTLLAAWRIVSAERSAAAPRLVLVGDGPLASDVRNAAESLPGLEWRGAQPLGEVLALMGDARVLVFPSLCFENSPRVILEAFARGLPVLASRRGSTGELVQEGVTGRLFEPGEPADLARALAWATAPGTELTALARGARAAFQASHTADRNAERLFEIYAEARRNRFGRKTAVGQPASPPATQPQGRSAVPRNDGGNRLAEGRPA